MEKQKKRNSSKWLLAIIFLLVLIAITIFWIIFDAGKVVNYREVSQSGILSLSKAEDTTTAATGKVIVKYVDTDGNEIAETKTFEGNVGSEYRIERPEFEGYLTYGKEPFQKSGNYQKEDIEIIFVYQSEDANVEIDEENNTITVKMKNAKEPKEYSIKIITKNPKGEFIKGVEYFASKSTGEVLRAGAVEGESFVVGTITINDEGKDTYIIEEDTAPYYEAPFGEEFEFNIVKIWDEQSNQYVISLDYDKNIEGLDIKVDGDEIIINVVNYLLTDKPKPEPEPTPEPTPEPKPEEPAEIKVFDLSIIKYISKVKVQNEKGTTEINRNIDKKDSLFKMEIDAKELAKTNLEITYKLVVENVGEIPGYATEIKDYVPKDLKFVENGEWELVDNNLVYNKLANKLLNPGEKEEIELTFTWKLDENNLGARNNQAEITEYKNDLDIKDITPDNIGKAELLVTVKTGREEICILTILTTLTVIATVIYAEKRRIENKGVK